MLALQFGVVAALVSVHLFAGKLRFLDVSPRSRWLSFAGGISVAYVFVHVFPELQEAQLEIGGGHGAEAETSEGWLDHHVYLVAMIGLVAFYGLELVVQREGPERGSAERDANERAVFRLHVGMFAVYNALIGYLLVHRVEQDVHGLLLFAFAYALHFVVNDHGLSSHHRERYRRVGRWVLSGAVLIGWLVGVTLEVSETVVHVLFALLAGATILNVLKEELPEERQSRFLPFVAGAIGYAGLMLTL